MHNVHKEFYINQLWLNVALFWAGYKADPCVHVSKLIGIYEWKLCADYFSAHAVFMF